MMNIGTKVKTAWGRGTVTELKKSSGFDRSGLRLTHITAIVVLEDGTKREVYATVKYGSL